MVLEYSTASVILIIAEGKVNIQEILSSAVNLKIIIIIIIFYNYDNFNIL